MTPRRWSRAGAREFSLEDAERTLPLVRRIVVDIVASYAAYQQRQHDIEALRGRPADDLVGSAAAALQERMDEAAAEIDGYIAELEQIGCQFKGFEPGLVDFPARWRGQAVLLCWRLGEERIDWWHAPDTGFAGRRPITDTMRRELGAAVRAPAGES